MRISATPGAGTDALMKAPPAAAPVKPPVEAAAASSAEPQNAQLAFLMNDRPEEAGDDALAKDKVQKAVDVLNRFMEVQNHSSRFVMHDGLQKYYVEIIDAKTEEVVREIPPKKLLDAFYVMQKFMGMIVDEKI